MPTENEKAIELRLFCEASKEGNDVLDHTVRKSGILTQLMNSQTDLRSMVSMAYMQDELMELMRFKAKLYVLESSKIFLSLNNAMVVSDLFIQ